MSRYMNFDVLAENVLSLIANQKYDTALPLAKELVQRNRLNLLANLCLAESLFGTGNYLESYKYYRILLSLQNKYKQSIVEHDVLQEQINITLQNCHAELASLPDIEKENFKRKFEEIDALDKSLELNIFTIPLNMKDYFGPHLWAGKHYYMARYDNWYCSYSRFDENQNGRSSKAEIFEICVKGKTYDVSENFPCLVPIASDSRDEANTLTFASAAKTSSHEVSPCQTFLYYRIDEPTEITGKNDMYVGKPLSLKHKQGNKKLVLNIFLDSFNWYFIQKYSLEEYMPNTARFFRNGTICNHFCSGSEFTYPSVASYWTGLRSTHHTVLNPNVHFPIPADIPLLSELFHDAGYLTAKIGGNDSVVPNYGYIRGIDRFVYEKAEQNFHVQDTVNETLEHLRAFGESDNFMWIEIQDLHEVAGYLKMPISLQSRYSAHTNEIDNLGGSSLYQSHSKNRSIIYGEQLRRIDFYLDSLYRYLEMNYNMDDIVVTFISDHGNGFNVEDGEPFMSIQRINVPLMLYGSNCRQAICNEWIETIDYPHILCHLANIQDERLAYGDGILPKFFGGTKPKDYIFSQSLCPHRNYEAHLITDAFRFYFKSNQLISNDCRINFDGIYSLKDAEGNEIYNEETLEYCISIVKEILGDYLIEETGENNE